MKANKIIRIGTRESVLAIYQANAVAKALNQIGITSEIIEITSDGDRDLATPLYEMGIQGIFTKSLDSALLQKRIDIAVHSCKDIPTKLAKGLVLNAVLERASPLDCLVLPAGSHSIDLKNINIIATSSLRRKNQWLFRYPHHTTENIRGNIQTRLKKLDESNWQGAIFAQAAIERLDIISHTIFSLDWMLPSPAQGAIALITRVEDGLINEVCGAINHIKTNNCISVERNFLAALQGGCAVPIAATAVINNDKVFFKGNIISLDAKQKYEVEMEFSLDQLNEAGSLAASQILKQGAESIIKTFRPTFETR